MPIYEYTCKECGKDFEALVRDSSPATCPDCNSANLEKQFSTFAAGSSDSSSGMGSLPDCPSCGIPGGSCGLN